MLSEEIERNCIFKDIWKQIKRVPNVSKRFLQQTTSLQLTTLKVQDSNNIILVANTHLYYHSEADHIRLIQLMMAVTYIKHRMSSISTQVSLIS